MKFEKIIKGFAAAAIVTVGMYVSVVGVFAAGTCKVKADAAKIRQSASTSADVVGSTTKGSKLDIVSKTTDSDGNTWYKVTVDGNTSGYIRSDLVTDVEGDVSSEGGDTSSNATATTEVTTTTVNPSSYKSGTTTDSVSVRESASTKANKKATADKGQAVTITGEATDESGKTWYQISYDSVTGFIRSDFINPDEPVEEEIVEEVPMDEGDFEVPEDDFEDDFEDEETTVAPNSDYELKYEANDEGVQIWYLYDHVKGTRQSLDNIFAVMEQSQNIQTGNTEQTSKMKTIIIIMGVVILVLIIAVTILLFKLRDSYDDWEEDDDDDDDDEDDEPAPARPVVEEDEDLDDEDIKIVNKRAKANKASVLTKPSKAVQEDRKQAWQSNNFLDVDDDMEFEFLDIDK